jgi:hypothetical protein
VLNAEGAGRPGVRLCDVPPASDEQEIELIDGMPVPMQHSTILFADGGSLKSLSALYGLGQLVRQGLTCTLFDWELDACDHRRRLERLFGDIPRDLLYMRCERPLVYEAERLRRYIRQNGILYAVLDSIGFGTDGPPEAAEHALGYNRALRSLGIGTLLTAHVTKSGEQADQRPFGSAFWHNSARSTWFGKLGARSPDGRILTVGLFHRKTNVERLHPAVGLEVEFADGRWSVRRVNPATVEELAVGLATWQRLSHALRSGPQKAGSLGRWGRSTSVSPRAAQRGGAVRRGVTSRMPAGGIGDLLGLPRHSRARAVPRAETG